jgi:hypothetical protein
MTKAAVLACASVLALTACTKAQAVWTKRIGNNPRVKVLLLRP